MFPTWAKLAVCVALLGALSAVMYRAGHNAAEMECAQARTAGLEKAAQIIRAVEVSDQQIVEERAEKVRVLTRTIVKVQREIISAPPRDCGFTPDERVPIHAAYCAGFPDAPDCLPDTLPDAPGRPGSG